MAHRVKFLSLLAAVGLLFTVLSGPVHGQDQTASGLLKQGLKQLDDGDAKSALESLRRVDPLQLNEAEQKQLNDALKKAKNAAKSPTPKPVVEPKKNGGDTKPEPKKPDPKKPEPKGNGDVKKPEPKKPAPDKMLIQKVIALQVKANVAAGNKAHSAGNYNEAKKHYEAALALDSDNAEAKAALAKVEVLLSKNVGSSLVTNLASIVKLKAEQAKATFTNAMTNAEKARSEGNYGQASDAIAVAKAIADQNKQYLSQADYASMKKATGDLAATIAAEEARAKAVKINETQRNVAIAEAKRRREAEIERISKVNKLLRQAREYQKQQYYEDALAALEQVLFLDPNNVAAAAMKEMIEDAIVFINQRKLRRHRSLQIARQSVDSIEASIPYSELIQYPPDWPELTIRRREMIGQQAGESEANRRVLEKLNQPIPVNFENNPFNTVVEYLRNVTGVNIFVNWRALEGAGIEMGAPVNLNLANVPAQRAIRLILDQVGGDLVPLAFTVDEGVVTISTKENIQKSTNIQTYDIRDLLVQVPNFTDAPDFDLVNITGNRGLEGGQDGQLFEQDEDAEEGLDRGQMVERIMTLVRETVDPEGWRSAGGLVSSMSELNGSLIVNTTSQNHREILSLLEQLRLTRALSINVESRFLLVDQNYLHEVGVDFDMSVTDLGHEFELGQNELGETAFTTAQDSISIADRPSTGIQGSFGETPDGGIPARALTAAVSGTFLNDVQVSLLIRATQANRRVINVSAPRLTFFNGQRAYVLIATQLAYISDLDPIVGTRAALFDPVISVISSGVILDVEGTVSADRRYVTLTARPSLARVLRLRGIFVVSPDGGVGGGDDDDDDDDDDAAPDVSRGIIEAPELELTTVRTTVSVPDKGTLLMGGQRLMVDVEIESGVPVLSKIPVLNRAFTNRSTVKDERTLLILIKPTIIMQNEKEMQLFPGMEKSVGLFGGDRPAPNTP